MFILFVSIFFRFPQKYYSDVGFSPGSPPKQDVVGNIVHHTVIHSPSKDEAYDKLRASDVFMRKESPGRSLSRNSRRGEFYEQNLGNPSLLVHDIHAYQKYSQSRKPSPFRTYTTQERIFSESGRENIIIPRLRGDMATTISTRGHLSIWTADPAVSAAEIQMRTFESSGMSPSSRQHHHNETTTSNTLNSTSVADLVLTRHAQQQIVHPISNTVSSSMSKNPLQQAAQQTFYSTSPARPYKSSSESGLLDHSALYNDKSNIEYSTPQLPFIAANSPSRSVGAGDTHRALQSALHFSPSPYSSQSRGDAKQHTSGGGASEADMAIALIKQYTSPVSNIAKHSVNFDAAGSHTRVILPSPPSPTRRLHGLSDAELSSLSALANRSQFETSVPGQRHDSTEFVTITGHHKGRSVGPADCLSEFCYGTGTPYKVADDGANYSPGSSATLVSPRIYTHRGRKIVETAPDHFNRPHLRSESAVESHREYPSRAFSSKLEETSRGAPPSPPSRAPPSENTPASARALYYSCASVGHDVLGNKGSSLLNDGKYTPLRGKDFSIGPVLTSRLEKRRDYDNSGGLIGQGMVGAGRNMKTPIFRDSSPVKSDKRPVWSG